MKGCDGVFHLAAVASVQRGNEDWLGTHRTNLTGTITVLECARTASASGAQIPVVYASSAAVFGGAFITRRSPTTIVALSVSLSPLLFLL
jgi:UDP-glucose 4-epimerase